MRAEYQKHKRRIATENLDHLGESDTSDTRILYRYFRYSLCPPVWTILKIDRELADGTDYEKVPCDELFEISPHKFEAELPPLDRLIRFLASYGEKARAYLGSLPAAVKKNPQYSAIEADWLASIELLDARLKTFKSKPKA